MKALTVRQPHAHKIWRGDKPIENRTWATSYRGPLLIHAGKSREEVEYWDAADTRVFGVSIAEMVFGAFIAQVDLVACFHINDMWPAEFMSLKDNEHAEGPYCLVLTNLRRLPTPIPYRGAQGLFDIPNSVVEPASAPAETQR